MWIVGISTYLPLIRVDLNLYLLDIQHVRKKLAETQEPVPPTCVRPVKYVKWTDRRPNA